MNQVLMIFQKNIIVYFYYNIFNSVIFLTSIPNFDVLTDPISCQPVPVCLSNITQQCTSCCDSLGASLVSCNCGGDNYLQVECLLTISSSGNDQVDNSGVKSLTAALTVILIALFVGLLLVLMVVTSNPALKELVDSRVLSSIP